VENTRAGPLAAARIIVLACLAREFCEAELTDSDHVARTMLAFGRYREEIWLVSPRRADAPEPESAPVLAVAPLTGWRAFVASISSPLDIAKRFVLAFVMRAEC